MAIVLGAAPLAAARAGGPAVPDTAFQVRLGLFVPSGGGQLWNDNEDIFTLDASDFEGATLGLSFVRAIDDQVDFGINVDFYEETALSQYRYPVPGLPGFVPVDPFGLPILHDTQLSIVPLTCDVRFLPGGRYRDRVRGRPLPRAAFYFGGGVGIAFWEYDEVGDFLDFSLDPPLIFPGRFTDDGAALEAHVLAGVELPIGRASSFVVEGRHSWADDDLGGDFQGLGNLELGGTALYGGMSFRF
jgi:hypothetical protein